MPVYMATSVFFDGIESIAWLFPYLIRILKIAPWLVLLYLVKWYTSGATNPSERKMHGRVVMVTGGTSGIGECVVRQLAQRGAQVLLLTQHSLTDPFIVEYIDDVRRDTENNLITAEQVDLASLHSIRAFATKWIDNSPVRRLDMVILCANTITPGNEIKSTSEGVEMNWQINYLANFHLLSILSPALRAQPPDRDVRVLFGTCSSYLGGDLLHITQPSAPPPATTKKSKKAEASSTPKSTSPSDFSPSNASATSKLALTTFALAFQKHLSSFKRPDSFPMNTKVFLIDPGFCRTPGTRRWLSWGSLLGLLLYLIFYPFWWLILKSPEGGAQSFLYAAMEEKFSRSGGLGGVVSEGMGTEETGVGGREGGWLIKECKDRKFSREEVEDEEKQKLLWKYSEEMVQEAEKRGAIERARVKREEEERMEEEEAVREMKEYRQKVGKKAGEKKEGSRRSKKVS